MFKLKRACVSCPFRKDRGALFMLHPERLKEIKEASAFQCHKTIDYDETDDEGCAGSGDRPQQCAGLMTVLHREGKPNQIMQVAERFGALDPSALEPDDDVYASWDDVVKGHGRGTRSEEPTSA